MDGTHFVWSSAGTIDMSTAVLGRPDLSFAKSGTKQLTVTGVNMSAWSDIFSPGDELYLIAPSVAVRELYIL